MDSVNTEIHNYIINELNDGEEFETETSLIQQGLIDSMGVMQLLTFLEKRFDIAIDLEDITAENFETIDRIGELVARARREAG